MQRAAAVEVEEGVKVLGAAAPVERGLARRAPLRQGPPEAMEALPWLAQAVGAVVVRMWVVQTAIGVAAAVGAAGQSCFTQPAP